MPIQPLRITKKLSGAQFDQYLGSYFGEPENTVYRAMSDEEYQGGLKNGYLKSNYVPELSEGEVEFFPAGTYAAEKPSANYVTKNSRIAQIRTDKSADWVIDDNRPNQRTFLTQDKIPMEEVTKVTPLVSATKRGFVVKEER